MSVGHAKDFWSGILFASLGLIFVFFAQEHELGTAARMGPAYFPTLLGGSLTALGCFIAVKAYFSKPSTDSRVTPFQWRVLGLILGAVLAFSLLLEILGLMLSIAIMVFIAVLASPQTRFKETLAMIAILDTLAYFTFVYGIGMLIPVWPSFL